MAFYRQHMEFHMQHPASGQLVQLSRANTIFALHLYQTMQDERKGQNLFFSPLSISIALAMTHLGARGNTANQIATVFRFSQVERDQLHGAFRELIHSLYQTHSGNELRGAHKLYVKSGYNFVQSFLEGTVSYYGAAPEAVDDFASFTATKSINDWVSKQTVGKITNLIAPGVLNDLTLLVLVNAIYFNGTWASKFRPENTTQDTFKVIDERKKVPVRLMIQEGEFRVAIDKTNDSLVLELPYKGNLSLLIALPVKDDGLGQLESELSADILQSWDRGLKFRQVKVMLPKFRLEAEYQLTDTLKRMGISDAFHENKANFEGISDRGLFISAVIHKAFVDVNEEGSEAAAATGIESLREGSSQFPREPEMPILFRADHPFLFMIRHRPKKSVIFIGRMMDPS